MEETKRTALTRAVEEARVKYNLAENEVYCDEKNRYVYVRISGIDFKYFRPFTAKAEVMKWICRFVKMGRDIQQKSKLL